jgi:hypothetical protein
LAQCRWCQSGPPTAMNLGSIQPELAQMQIFAAPGQYQTPARLLSVGPRKIRQPRQSSTVTMAHASIRYREQLCVVGRGGRQLTHAYACLRMQHAHKGLCVRAVCVWQHQAGACWLRGGRFHAFVLAAPHMTEGSQRQQPAHLAAVDGKLLPGYGARGPHSGLPGQAHELIVAGVEPPLRQTCRHGNRDRRERRANGKVLRRPGGGRHYCWGRRLGACVRARGSRGAGRGRCWEGACYRQPGGVRARAQSFALRQPSSWILPTSGPEATA